MVLKIKQFSELKTGELLALLKMRQDVFIIEQQCLYEDIDEFDTEAVHLCLYRDGKLAAYARVFAPGIIYEAQCAIGRIVVHPDFRGGDYGKMIIEESIDYCRKQYKERYIRIEAQAALTEYYKKFGFVAQSAEYPVDGINHVQMVLKP